MTENELLASGYRMGRSLLHRSCDDLTEEEFRHQPVPGANSTAWIIGHLAVTARRTADRLGATDLPILTEEFVGRFSVTRQPAGVQAELGTKTDLLALLDVCVDKLMAAIATLPAGALAGPPVAPSPFAKTYGEAVLFGSLHFALHGGQISTIRRSLGKPPQV